MQKKKYFVTSLNHFRSLYIYRYFSDIYLIIFNEIGHKCHVTFVKDPPIIIYYL